MGKLEQALGAHAWKIATDLMSVVIDDETFTYITYEENVAFGPVEKKSAITLDAIEPDADDHGAVYEG